MNSSSGVVASRNVPVHNSIEILSIPGRDVGRISNLGGGTALRGRFFP